MTEEEKEQSRQLNQISYINALNTHNWELQQKVMMLNAENERLREALRPFAYYASLIPDDISDTCSASGTVGNLRAALKALGENELVIEISVINQL